jgi:HSP20 family protein
LIRDTALCGVSLILIDFLRGADIVLTRPAYHQINLLQSNLEDKHMATVARWNPIRDMITLREAMDQLFNENYLRSREARQQGVAWQLPLDAYTTEDAIVLKADVPGLKPEELEVTLEADTLTIRGELKNRAENQNYVLRERASGPFERVLTINTPIDTTKVEATFEDGVVQIVLPKAEAVKPKQIKVTAAKNNGK